MSDIGLTFIYPLRIITLPDTVSSYVYWKDVGKRLGHSCSPLVCVKYLECDGSVLLSIFPGHTPFDDVPEVPRLVFVVCH